MFKGHISLLQIRLKEFLQPNLEENSIHYGLKLVIPSSLFLLRIGHKTLHVKKTKKLIKKIKKYILKLFFCFAPSLNRIYSEYSNLE
jgi:hypothetical protein